MSTDLLMMTVLFVIMLCCPGAKYSFGLHELVLVTRQHVGSCSKTGRWIMTIYDDIRRWRSKWAVRYLFLPGWLYSRTIVIVLTIKTINGGSCHRQRAGMCERDARHKAVTYFRPSKVKVVLHQHTKTAEDLGLLPPGVLILAVDTVCWMRVEEFLLRFARQQHGWCHLTQDKEWSLARATSDLAANGHL